MQKLYKLYGRQGSGSFAVQVALEEIEAHILADALQHGAGVVAQVAAGPAVEDDLHQRRRPSPVA